MQKEILTPCPVFESDGKVHAAGWARSELFEYNPGQSKSKNHSERCCYMVNNGEVSFYLSLENLGREFSVKLSAADLRRGGAVCDCVVKKGVIRKNDLPMNSADCDFFFSDKQLEFRITNSVYGKILKGEFLDFGGTHDLFFNIVLKKKKGESLNELSPFERNRKFFYFKEFEPGYSARGVIRVGKMEYALSENSARAYLDLTRFYKPRKHNYQRLSADCDIDGKRFSLCLASRVGDNRYGNENCFFIDGKLEKLSQINVKGTPGRLDRPFYFRGGMHALDITFKPFTVSGDAMSAVMDKTTVLYGRLYGTINRFDYPMPLTLDNAQAHLIFSEF